MFLLNIFNFLFLKKEGAFALVMKSTKCYPGECVATKRGSPLLIGIKVSVYDIKLISIVEFNKKIHIPYILGASCSK